MYLIHTPSSFRLKEEGECIKYIILHIMSPPWCIVVYFLSMIGREEVKIVSPDCADDRKEWRCGRCGRRLGPDVWLLIRGRGMMQFFRRCVCVCGGGREGWLLVRRAVRPRPDWLLYLMGERGKLDYPTVSMVGREGGKNWTTRLYTVLMVERDGGMGKI